MPPAPADWHSQALNEEVVTDLADLLEHAEAPDMADEAGDDDGLGDLLERLHRNNGRENDGSGGDGAEAPVVLLDEFREPDDVVTPASEVTPDYNDPDWDVLVRVCGEITVEGALSDLRPREKAVLTYIALNGSTNLDKLQDAIWAGAAVTRKRVQNVISIVRGSVGDTIELAGDSRISTGPGLMTDLELIQRRIDYASHQDDPNQRAETLRAGLALVTGRVCTCPPGGNDPGPGSNSTTGSPTPNALSAPPPPNWPTPIWRSRTATAQCGPSTKASKLSASETS